MNKMLCLFLSLFTITAAFAQDVVDWKFQSKKLADGRYEVRLVANIQEPWHIYSTTQEEGGPLPTKISFSKNPLVTPDGKIREDGDLQMRYEEVFELDTRYFSDKVEFVQIVKVRGKAKTRLAGTVEYMACTDEQCLPPAKRPFEVDLN